MVDENKNRNVLSFKPPHQFTLGEVSANLSKSHVTRLTSVFVNAPGSQFKRIERLNLSQVSLLDHGTIKTNQKP